MKIIEVNGLTKKYRKHTILKDINVSFFKSKCYMLIGNNGAGKSTFIKCLIGATHFKGEIIKMITRIGYVPEKVFLPQHLTVSEFLEEVASCKGVDEGLDSFIDSNLSKWSILEKKNSLIKTLSKGMLQKVSIIQSMIDDGELLIFDEVLNGLDQDNQHIFFDTIRSLKEEGKTIIVSTHYPKEYLDIVDVILEIKNQSIYEKKVSDYKTN